MSKSKSKVLVTGADGFIGSHLVEKLVESGYNVRAFCFYNSNGSWGWLDNLSKEVQAQIDVVLGDIRDPLCVREAMRSCDVVFHLAALIAIPFSYQAPKSYIDTNIYGTLNVIQAARELEISKVVHTSTSETYGSAQYVPIDEKHPVVGQSPYSASKIAADQLAISYWRSFGTPIAILRPFNTYGPRQSARAVIPTIITQVAAGKRKINLGSLTPTRDFNFVDDTCNAFMAVAFSDKTTGNILNSASRFEISIGDTAALIASIMNVNLEINTDQARVRPKTSEVDRLFGDNSLINKLTGWSPSFGNMDGFRRGLAITVDWFDKKENLSFYKQGIYSI
ncbi:NAD-dependent 4,6-dehydratase LegB [Prochlorococcus sp. MIT 1011]|uniref:NAD-dependent 4,6-dehydratase LegB n=1 Tax=Prochlorococcus sp. MIT 1011 TaxID=3082520 RepID=UPI0039B5F3C8